MSTLPLRLEIKCRLHIIDFCITFTLTRSSPLTVLIMVTFIHDFHHLFSFGENIYAPGYLCKILEIGLFKNLLSRICYLFSQLTELYTAIISWHLAMVMI